MTTFNELYKDAIPFDFKGSDAELKLLVTKSLDVKKGTLLKSMADYGRRVLVVTGERQNIVVYDRYPDIPTSRFNYFAPTAIYRVFPAAINNGHIDQLINAAKTI